MKPVLQRIAINGLLTAVFLGVIGMILGRVGTMFLPPSEVAITEPGEPNPDAELMDAIQYRTPLLLAVWGFVFVAVGEVLLHAWRSRRPAPPAPTAAEKNTTEQMLQELLAKAEAEEKARADAAGTKHRDLGGESIEIKGLPAKETGHRTPGGESREVNLPPEPEAPKKD